MESIMNFALRQRAVTVTEQEDGRLGGYATVFDTPYPIAPGLTETIMRGAFDEKLRARDGIVPVFWSHGLAKRGEEPVGWARLREDGQGVAIDEVEFFDTDRGRAIDAATKAKALREWSLAFTADKIRQRQGDEGIERGEIIELSVVVRGAAPTTMTFQRADDLVRLREAGLLDAGAEIIDETEEPNPTDPPEGGEGGEGSEDPENEGEPAVELREQAYGLLKHPGVRDAIRKTFNKE